MIPIRDHNPSGSQPIINYLLITINIAVFIYMLSLSMASQEMFIFRFSLIPELILQGKNLDTLLTSMFLHGGFGHILSNMLFLNIFGDNLEDRIGHLKYLVYYLICGLGATALQLIFNPFSSIPNLGASGAIAGIMGGYLLLFPQHKIDILFSFGWYLNQTSVPAYFMLFYWFIAQLFSGFGSLAVAGQSMGGIAYFAHIGGFVTGYLLLAPFKKKLLRYWD